MSETNFVTFPSADGQAELEGVWYLPARRATNGVLIGMPGTNNNKDVPPLPQLCEGAALLGLSALRFDFRFRQAKFAAQATKAGLQEVDDLLGAYNFFLGFGKEIKPKRFYLAGKSLGGLAALRASQEGGPLAGKLNGVIVLGLARPAAGRPEFLETGFLAKLTCPTLFIIGERDLLGSPAEFRQLLARLPVPARLEVIAGAGHSYQYLPLPGEEAVSEQEAAAKAEYNYRQVAEIALAWLEEQDRVRDNFRK